MWQALETSELFQTDEVIDKRKDGSLFSIQTTMFTVSHGNSDYFIQLLQPTKKIIVEVQPVRRRVFFRR